MKVQKKLQYNKVIQRINENSESQNLFCLRLYGIDQDAKKDIALFSYEDSAHGWVLNLNPLQFKEMKEFLGTEGFPQDLFYPEECVVSQPFKLFGILPFGEKIYSPNQWRVLQELSKKS